MKKTKQIIVLLIILSMVIAFIPFQAFAQGYDVTIGFKDGTVNGNTVSFTIGESTVNVTLNSNYTISSNKEITIDSEAWLSALTFSDNFNADTMNIKIYSDEGFQANYILNEDGTLSRDGEGGVPNSFYFVVEAKTTNQPEVENPPVTDEFYGTVFFTWNNNNNVCIAEIDNLQPGGRDGYPMNYIKESEVVDFLGKVLDISKVGNDYYWLWDSAQLIIQDENITKDWSTFRDFIEEHKREYAIDPCGSINGNNTITTNGDRVFRATIYQDNKYEAISFSNNANDYEYFPSFWDDTFFSSTVDISGTTKTNPAEYEAYLLEKTIKFKTGENSKYNITSVKALVDNKDAVTVKNNNGVFEITFNSNYYDKVILELTDVQGNNYYVKICRTVMQVHDNFGPGITEAPITAEIYYPEEYSYNDFEVYATINYKDGSSKTEKATVTELIDQFDGTKLGYEDDGGENLKRAAYEVEANSKVETVSFTVIYKNTSNNSSYGGTFAGSGKGITYDVEAREIIYE